MILVNELQVWCDQQPRSAAEQMALDECLFQSARDQQCAWLRFYQWNTPCLSIGYFGALPEGTNQIIVRRMTGGGLVEHGDDLTFCLVLPVGSEGSALTTEQRYKVIHEKLRISLLEFGIQTHLGDISKTHASGACFSNPVRWDLLDSSGTKIAGGAQRNSRGTIIHQGSIQLPHSLLFNGENGQQWMLRFAQSLALQLTQTELQSANFSTILDSLVRKYQNPEWKP